MKVLGTVFRIILAVFVSLVFLVMLAAGPVIAEEGGEAPPAQGDGAAPPSSSEGASEVGAEEGQALVEEAPETSSEVIEEENDSATTEAAEEKGEKGEKDKAAASEQGVQTYGAAGGGGAGAAGADSGISVASPDTVVFTGAALTEVPIIVPPGRGGVAPRLVLRYNSYRGNGWLGVGWDLDLGAIQRATKHGVSYSAHDYVFT